MLEAQARKIQPVLAKNGTTSSTIDKNNIGKVNEIGQLNLRDIQMIVNGKPSKSNLNYGNGLNGNLVTTTTDINNLPGIQIQNVTPQIIQQTNYATMTSNPQLNLSLQQQLNFNHQLNSIQDTRINYTNQLNQHFSPMTQSTSSVHSSQSPVNFVTSNLNLNHQNYHQNHHQNNNNYNLKLASPNFQNVSGIVTSQPSTTLTTTTMINNYNYSNSLPLNGNEFKNLSPEKARQTLQMFL